MERGPLAQLICRNAAAAHRRRIRRAPNAEEVGRLLACTLQGPKRFGMPGVERYRLYSLAAWRGLRAGEIRKLRVANLIFDGMPRRRIRAEVATNRRQTEVTLRAELVEAFREQAVGKLPEAPLFRLPDLSNLAQMPRDDLEMAGVAYETELVYPTSMLLVCFILLS
ncbi:MAG: site-specific integrase [Gemmatales bacterium]|nr:site-specific integrase [Gemmatales bacterium]